MKSNPRATGGTRVKVEYALGKKLFPFPQVNSNFLFYARYSFGVNYNKTPPTETIHLKKSEAIKIVNKEIINECEQFVNEFIEKTNIRYSRCSAHRSRMDYMHVAKVIWRYAEYGYQAHNFLFINDSDELCLLIKVGKRYKLITISDWDNDVAEVNENLFEPLVDAYFKWKDTGEPTLWHEPCSNYIRRNKRKAKTRARKYHQDKDYRRRARLRSRN